MSNELGELFFVLGGVIVAVLLIFRMRRLSSNERNAAATAAFGLFLCGRYAALIESDANWLFTLGVGFMMWLLAYRSLGFDNPSAVAAD